MSEINEEKYNQEWVDCLSKITDPKDQQIKKLEELVHSNAIAFSEWMDSDEYSEYVHDLHIVGEPTDNASMYKIYQQKYHKQ